MEQALSSERPSVEQNRRLAEVVGRERDRLRNFIRTRVADAGDAEDILQDVFYELVEAYRLMKPVEQVGAWLFRVARNRIIDLFQSNTRSRSPRAPMRTTGWKTFCPPPTRGRKRPTLALN